MVMYQTPSFPPVQSYFSRRFILRKKKHLSLLQKLLLIQSRSQTNRVRSLLLKYRMPSKYQNGISFFREFPRHQV